MVQSQVPAINAQNTVKSITMGPMTITGNIIKHIG